MNYYMKVKRSGVMFLLDMFCYCTLLKVGLIQYYADTGLGMFNSIYLIALAILYMFNSTTRMVYEYWYIPAKTLQEIVIPYALVVLIFMQPRG